MACEVIWTPQADNDVDVIIAYLTGETVGRPQAAEHVLREVDDSIERIRAFPRLYSISNMPRLARRKCRVCFVLGYALIYQCTGQPSNEIVHVVRLVPANSDYARLV